MPTALPLPTRISQGFSRKRKPRVLHAQFGDGYSEDAPDGLNALVDECSITYENLTLAERNSVWAVLDAVGGWDVLTFTPPGDYVSPNSVMPLPSRLLATYFTVFSGVPRITDVPLAYNQIYIFQATLNGTTGAYHFTYGSSVTAAEIYEVRARGQRVVLTIGGQNEGFNFQTRAQSDAFIASFKTMYTQLGAVDGVDFNNFENFIGSSPTEMIYIAQQLKAFYGPNFSVSAPPHPGQYYAPADWTLMKAMADAGVLDYAGPQFYDAPDFLNVPLVISIVNDWVQHMGDATKVVVGLGANYSNGMPLSDVVTVWNAVRAANPSLRGVFGWSTQTDKTAGYTFASTMKPLVITNTASKKWKMTADGASETVTGANYFTISFSLRQVF